MVLLLSLLFVIGACFGSFINVVTYRLPKGENIFLGHSHCDHCKRKIPFYDLLPIVSYLLLRGTCRFCHKEIGLRVFLVELLSGLVFVLFLFSFINWIVYALYCGIFLIALAIALIDIDYGIIPDTLLVIFGILSLIFVLGSPSSVYTHLLTTGASFIFFLSVFLITRGRGMGFGDVKYALVIGLLLSPIQLVAAFYAAFLTGALFSLILIIRGKKKLRGGSIPFGPFLSLGVIVALLFENQILQIVLKLLYR